MTSTHPTHQHPVLLFPMRLETRYDGSDLLLRITKTQTAARSST